MVKVEAAAQFKSGKRRDRISKGYADIRTGRHIDARTCAVEQECLIDRGAQCVQRKSDGAAELEVRHGDRGFYRERCGEPARQEQKGTVAFRERDERVAALVIECERDIGRDDANDLLTLRVRDALEGEIAVQRCSHDREHHVCRLHANVRSGRQRERIEAGTGDNVGLGGCAGCRAA